ncbi:MAG TPA: universal stress protein [Phototrophicaceae bacterium]|nr:universal stress protein [Phototrophicaceae bacterium]
MFKRILVPLDGSLLAKTALDVAARLVDSTCEILLVNAVQDSEILNYPSSPMSLNPEYYPTLETLESNAKRYLEEIADSLRQQGYRVHTVVEVGDAADCVIHTADKGNVDAIVMSTHGRSGVSRLLFGSVTSRVLSGATCPVLVVPSQETQHKHERKLADVNFA